MTYEQSFNIQRPVACAVDNDGPCVEEVGHGSCDVAGRNGGEAEVRLRTVHQGPQSGGVLQAATLLVAEDLTKETI